MSFDETTFNIYPNFDNLRCYKLSFSNTVFGKGARFRNLDVDEVLFEPKELNADATFYHREKADIDAGVLRGDYKGKIGKFQYRHQLLGNGITFMVGMRFTEQAKFTDCELDKIQFSFIDEISMSKCFFANSTMEDTKFYNCNFPFMPDRCFVFDFKITSCFGGIFLSILLLSAVFSFIVADSYLIALVVPLLFPNIIIMPILHIIGALMRKIFRSHANSHIAIADDIAMNKKQDKEHIEDNYKTIREIYRQLRVNFEKHGDYQTAGDFYYSQRYVEMINFYISFNLQFMQSILFNIHYFINGFGERYLRAFIWFVLTVICFIFFTNPNGDFISTKSTPEYFLSAYRESNSTTSQIYYNRSSITGDVSKMDNPTNFMEIATTNYITNSRQIDTNKTFFGFDNRFDFDYTSQLIPTLKNDLEVRFAHSISKIIAPFISEEKKWFQDRSEKAYYLGFLETVLLWFFFLAFLLAIKNRIRR